MVNDGLLDEIKALNRQIDEWDHELHFRAWFSFAPFAGIIGTSPGARRTNS